MLASLLTNTSNWFYPYYEDWKLVRQTFIYDFDEMAM